MIKDPPRATLATSLTNRPRWLNSQGHDGHSQRLSWQTGLVLFACIPLVLWNIWWFWRDSLPVLELSTIETLVRDKHYTQAETALRDRLRRSRHDGGARILLARTLAAQGDMQ